MYTHMRSLQLLYELKRNWKADPILKARLVNTMLCQAELYQKPVQKRKDLNVI